MRGALESHGGTVAQLLGDGVNAVFGIPRVAEDDAIRAVRAAVAMHDWSQMNPLDREGNPLQMNRDPAGQATPCARLPWRARLLPVVILLALAAACGDGQSDDCDGDTTPLRCAARHADIRVGVGMDAGDAAAEEVAAGEFDAVSTEGTFFWSAIHPERERWDYGRADQTLAWAGRHDLFVTATHFVWDQIFYSTTPGWVKAITSPEELRQVMREHLETISLRYGRGIDRWIVVNEPLQYLGDTTQVQANHFSRTLGPDWIAEAFRIAHEAAPDSELWLNEIFLETDPAKARALVDLARTLVDERVPIDGVGIQGHLFKPLVAVAPDVALVRETMEALAALGLEVALTEVDAPVLPDTPDQLGEQARRIRALVEVCLAVPRCRSITFWNLHDGASWLSGLFGRSDLAPTLFDATLQPKPAYFAVQEAFSAAAGRE